MILGGLVKSGQWSVRHKTVPDLAIGEQYSERGSEDGYGEDNGDGRWSQPLGSIEEADEDRLRGRAR